MRRILQCFFALLLFISSANPGMAQNTVQKVEQVTQHVNLTSAVDYVITGTSPFATAGSIDIQNPDATVIFQNIKPSLVVANYLKKVTVNGLALENNVNCRVSIYLQGAIVMPHSDTKNADKTDFYPLTVYTGDNCTGESYQYNGDSRRTTGPWVNTMRSFTLKRGYMLTVANMSDGTGYSHCYIANHNDITVQLRTELAGKVGFFRIFRWQWPGKKGSCDVGPTNLNATWHYNWGAGTSSNIDYEYVPQRHHEAGTSNGQGWKGAWESWSTINASDGTCTHVLGQNEPDNTSGAGEVYTYVTEIPTNPREKCATSTLADHAAEFLYSGKRVGTFACCNPNTGWVSEYVNWCRNNNIRVDFVATHYYIGGTTPQGCIDRLWSLYNVTGLPVWATEWNNGANWTTESGFSTDSKGWYSWGSDNTKNSEMNGVWLTDVLARADKSENHWLERLAVYNAVETKREVWTNNALSAGGKLYAAYNSTFAYDDANEYFMPWNYKSPTDLTAEYFNASRRVAVQWVNNNGKQTDSTYIERKLDGERTWTVLAKRGMPTAAKNAFNDTLATGISGLVTYRVRNFDSDKKTRTSSEVQVAVGGANGNSIIQFGSIDLVDPTTEVTIDFNTEFADKPVALFGPTTDNNSYTTVEPYMASGSVSNRQLKYVGIPLSAQPSGTSTYSKAEEVPFIAMLPGNYKFGDMDVEVGRVTGVKNSPVEVTFTQPFPEGVTPVVIATINVARNKDLATMHKIWDVTNTGFKCMVAYEEKHGKNIVVGNTLAYMAVTPGYECIDEEKGYYMGANIGSTDIYSRARKEEFTIPSKTEEGKLDTIYCEDPMVFAELQTNHTPVNDNNIPVMTSLRRGLVYTQSIEGADGSSHSVVYGTRFRRIVDCSVQSSTVVDAPSSTADRLGWIVLHKKLSFTPTAIETPKVFRTQDPIEVNVHNRVVFVNGYKDFELYTTNGTRCAANATQAPGVYVVRAGGRIAKVLIR